MEIDHLIQISQKIQNKGEILNSDTNYINTSIMLYLNNEFDDSIYLLGEESKPNM